MDMVEWEEWGIWVGALVMVMEEWEVEEEWEWGVWEWVVGEGWV